MIPTDHLKRAAEPKCKWRVAKALAKSFVGLFESKLRCSPLTRFATFQMQFLIN